MFLAIRKIYGTKYLWNNKKIYIWKNCLQNFYTDCIRRAQLSNPQNSKISLVSTIMTIWHSQMTLLLIWHAYSSLMAMDVTNGLPRRKLRLDSVIMAIFTSNETMAINSIFYSCEHIRIHQFIVPTLTLWIIITIVGIKSLLLQYVNFSYFCCV